MFSFFLKIGGVANKFCGSAVIFEKGTQELIV